MLSVTKLTCAYQTNPLGLSEAKPCFGWVLVSDKNNVLQKSYHVQVAGTPAFDALIWDSGVQACDNSVCVPYVGPVLLSGCLYYWRVKINDGMEESSWSDTARFEMGLLSPDDWKGCFISPETEEDAAFSKGHYMRKSFTLDTAPAGARLYATALGMYELYLNGERVGEDLLTPGWTEYAHRLQHQTYDVTHMLREGENVLGIVVGAGWYKGDLAGWLHRRNVYGNKVAALAQLDICGQDGSRSLIVTDGDWKHGESPIVSSELYHGEHYDARLEKDDWANPGFDDCGWQAVHILSQTLDIVVPQDGEPTRRQEVLSVLEVITTPKGETVLDFGQNIAGWVRFRVKGNSGDKVVLKHAEVLDKDGNFYTANMRSAKTEICYTLRGGEEESFEPHFTFQGFRYVHVESYPGKIDPADFEAVVIHSNMPRIGEFSCSEPLVNQLHHNILWGLKGNFVDICTDCPQRDERLGWTGDAQVFARMATYLVDTRVFFRKWLRDMQASQKPDGGIPYVVPDALPVKAESRDNTIGEYAACGWGDAATIVPWTQYMAGGDIGVLRENYPMMKRWVEYIRNIAKDEVLWDSGFHFGDWLALDAEEGSCFGATPVYLLATAYYAYSTEILSKTAEILGFNDDAKFYTDLRGRIDKAYATEYFTEDGFLIAKTQTAQIITLAFGLAPEVWRKNVMDTLLTMLSENGEHLSTGFLGTPYFCHVLTNNDALDVAYALLLKKDYPSWLYPVLKGATTIWEHWDGIKLDGSMWSEGMNSFNHYAYGAIGDWLYRVVAGMDASKAGYKHIVFRPRPGGGFTNANAKVVTPCGEASIAWKTEGGKLYVDIKVPHNTTAMLILPDGSEREYGSGEYSAEV